MLLLLAPSGQAQTSDPQIAFPKASNQAGGGQAGKYRLGPFYLTPRFRIGPISYDSNIFYSATEVQSDVIVAAGPSLDAVAPLGTSWRFYANGALDYLYFVRTASQRQFTGAAAAGFTFRGAHTDAVLEEGYQKTFGRPGYDVDERVEQSAERTQLTLDRTLLERVRLRLEGLRRKAETPTSGDYLGTDFASALTQNQYLAAAEVGFALSIKTSLVARGEYDWRRFPLEPLRDGERILIAGGLRTDSTALVAGRALAGRRIYTPDAVAIARSVTYVDVDARIGSPRTRLTLGYSRDLQDSFFLPQDGYPVQLVETATVMVQRQFSTRFDLRLFVRDSRYRTEAPITIDPEDGPPQTQKRDDKNRDAGLDVGYRFRPSFRVGVTATYRDRGSPFSTFNVEGLLIGFNAQLNPDLSWLD